MFFAPARWRIQDCLGQHEQLLPCRFCVVVVCERQGTGEGFAPRVSGSVRDSSESWSVAAMDLEDGREAICSWLSVLHVPGHGCAGFRSASGEDPKSTSDTKATDSAPLAIVLGQPSCRYVA